MGMRTRSIAAALLPPLILAACASVPAEQVRVYTDAFDEARTAGNRLYDEVSPIVAANQPPPAAAPVSQPGPQPTAFVPVADPPAPATTADVVCPRQAASTPYPACFNPGEFLPGAVPGEPASIAARRRALDTIATYNAIALRLASGETAEAVGAQVRRLASNASALASLTGVGATALPITGLAGDTAAQLAAWAETLRAERQLREAIAAGAPIVHDLIDALVADTARIYAFKREDVGKRLDALVKDGQLASFDARDVAAGHARPEGPFADRLAQIDQRFTNARGRIGGLPFVSLAAVAGTEGAEPFGETTLRELDDLTARIEATAEEHDGAVQALNQLHAALGEYVLMLHATDEALDGVAAAVAAPRTVTISPSVLAARAVEVRDQARQVSRVLREP